MDVEKSLRPVEVRRHLEKMGHDVELARKKYAMLSTFSHIGGTGETLILEDIGGMLPSKSGGISIPDFKGASYKTAIRRVVNSLRSVSELDTRMSRLIIAQLRDGLPKVFRLKKCFDVSKS